MNKKLLIVIGSFAAAFVLMGYLGWAMLIKPVNLKIAAKKVEKSDTETKLTDAKSKAAQYDKFRAQAENIRRDLNLISMRLDPDYSVREMRRFQGKIYASREARKITTSKRERSKEAGLTSLDAVPLTVELEGGFHEIGYTLSTLMSGNRLVVPFTLDFKPGTGGEGTSTGALWEPSTKATVVMSVYVEPLPSGGVK